MHCLFIGLRDRASELSYNAGQSIEEAISKNLYECYALEESMKGGDEVDIIHGVKTRGWCFHIQR
jgi:hypothetical protein